MKRRFDIFHMILLGITMLVLPVETMHAQKEGDDVVIGKYRHFSSKILGETFTYLEHLPPGYEKGDKKYPVLYVLNCQMNSTFANAAATVDRLGSEQVPGMILIGLSNTGRAADYMPVKPRTDEPNEGADTLLSFLEKEFMPYIEQNYRTESYRILMGQSNTGLFTLHVLLTRPGSFNAYIVASPSLGWCYDRVVKKTETLFSAGRAGKRYLHITYGGHDLQELVNRDTEKYIKLLTEKAPPWLEWKAELLKHDGHVPLASLNNGLLFLFSDYMIPQAVKNQGLAAVDAYYDRLTRKYGFVILPPEGVLFNMAFHLKKEKKMEEAAALFETLVKRYPRSSRGYFLLGETYRETGNTEAALKNFNKVIDLDESPRFKRAAETRIKTLQKQS